MTPYIKPIKFRVITTATTQGAMLYLSAERMIIIAQRRPSFKQPFTAYFAEKKRRSADFFFQDFIEK